MNLYEFFNHKSYKNGCSLSCGLQFILGCCKKMYRDQLSVSRKTRVIRLAQG
ncbi:hypothetical protein [Aquimarina sp. RZ0]|uniref:hypothetical protein n=1 Tax=Aquimarina sp. RZ0 TaxID=2607730 RepID=UPI00165FE543|nr:hypothetical protein [Aquimarina sp. RZ0]